MKKLTTVLIVLCLFLGLQLGLPKAQAQNRYHPDETSGITLQGGAVVAETVTNYAAMGTLTLDGRFDLGIAYATPHDKTGSGRTYLWREVTPFLEFSIMRPQATRPFGLDIATSHTTITFNEGHSDTRGGGGYSAGLAGYWLLKDEGGVTMLPRFGLSYVHAEAWSQLTPDHSRIEKTVESLLVGLEFSVLINETFLVAPAISFFDGSSTLALMAGVVFP